MKIITLAIWALVCLQFASGQCDFVTPRYGVESIKNIKYGSGTQFNGQEKDLFLNIYRPIGDNNIKRPMIIWCFGGGFFQGKKEDLESVCIESAKRGYVAVTIDYRLGFEVPTGLVYPAAFDSHELARAGFRAIADLKGAIRFMKARYAQDSTDIEKVFAGGFSAGAFTALGAGFIDKESEKPASCSIQSTVNGRARLDMGSIDGTIALNNGYDASVVGVLDIFGGVFDTSHIEPQDNKLLIMYHQTGDPVVNCGHSEPYWTIPFISGNYPKVFGTCMIDKRLKNLGKTDKLYYDSWIFTGTSHAIHDNAAVFDYYFKHVHDYLCQSTSSTNLKRDNIEVNLYPNPAKELCVLEISERATISIMNSAGVLLENISLEEGRHTIQLSMYPTGVYILRCLVSNKVISKQIIHID